MRRSDQVFPEAEGSSNLGSDVDDHRPIFDRALREILRQLGMPFTSLRGNRPVGSRSFFCSTAHVKTLVRLHLFASPKQYSAKRKLRAKGKVMVNIHRGLQVPTRDIGLALR